MARALARTVPRRGSRRRLVDTVASGKLGHASLLAQCAPVGGRPRAASQVRRPWRCGSLCAGIQGARFERHGSGSMATERRAHGTSACAVALGAWRSESVSEMAPLIGWFKRMPTRDVGCLKVLRLRSF